MKLRAVLCLSTLAWLAPSAAHAGGLFTPGAGAVSTTRAGAAVASADDGEAMVVNPAGLAKTHGTTLTFSVAALSYAMKFTRSGNYPTVPEDVPYAGQPYQTVTNSSKPPLGIGSVQPVPVIAVVSDLGGLIPKLHVAAGVYAPNGYPFRDMTNGYTFNGGDDLKAPPATRYDVMKQDGAIILPSIAAAYSITPQIDVGARYSSGFANVKSTTGLWGVPANYSEWVKQDATIAVDASDHFVENFGLGATYRPWPELEFGANYTSPINISAKGTAVAINGPAVSINGTQVVITPPPDSLARCGKGGTQAVLKGCAQVDLPMTAQVGGRYKFLDADGAMKGDVELDFDWENWGKHCNFATDSTCVDPGDYRVVIDAVVGTVSNPDGLAIKDARVQHGFRDTYGIRLGGSYITPLYNRPLTLRGGISYETATAKPGWERADVDGAARTTIAVGAGYQVQRWDINAGFGYIYEGTRTNSGNCHPTASNMGCLGTGVDAPLNQRTGPDPINPILIPEVQSQDPINQGTIQSHYIMIMLGASTWF